jgi:hypothetical protein
MSSLAQIVLKAGVSGPPVAHSLAGGFRWSAVVSVAASPLVWIGLGIYFASAAVWLFVLASAGRRVRKDRTGASSETTISSAA